MADPNIFTLEGLGLRLDKTADVEPHIAPLLSSSASSQIKHINLSGNTIGVEAAEFLASQLSKLSSVESANLADIFTSRLLSEIPPALEALLSALLHLKQLHTVNLSDNAFGLNTQAPLIKFLQQHKPLRHLILNNNGLGPEAGANIAYALTKLAEAKSEDPHTKTVFLETIVCGRNRLESGSSVAWARALAAHASTLREVRMAQNGIRIEGVQKILLDGLRHAKNLEVLDLQDNLFTLPGAQALVQVLGGWSELKELSVQDTLLRPRGGIILAEALTKGANKNLEVLRLQYNEIDGRGVRAIANALQVHALPKLRRLELNGNKFSEEDPIVESLAETLTKRKAAAGAQLQDDDDDAWGLDDLDELEEESEEEASDEIDDEGEDRIEEKAEDVKVMKEVENKTIAEEQDDEIDALADKIAKTHV